MNQINSLISTLLSRSGVTNNPIAQNYLNVIQSNDYAKGQQIADNLCRTYGVTREQAIQQAMKFFGIN